MRFLVTVVFANSGNQYVVVYDSDTGIEVTQEGSAPQDLTVTEEELRYDNGELRYQNCVGDDRHTVYMSTSYPFATFTIETDHPSCVVVPPTPPTPPATPPPVVTLNYVAYQIQFQNDEAKIVTANIYDQTTYEEGRTIEYRPLKPAGDPVVIECIDNDEDKFTPVRAKQAILKFNSSNQYDLNLFSDGQDNRWYVEVLISDQIKFKGFLVLNDLQEDFLSPPNVVTLTAIDGLGTLKTIPLTNFEGVSPIVVRPKTHYRWIDYLGWALSKTSLTIPINICHNLREENTVDDPFWSQIYLDPKTFEDEIGTCVDCYEVIEKLLAEECFITQRNGEWWVQRVDEIDSRDRYVYQISYDLSMYVLLDPVSYDKTIKKTESIKWIERSAYVRLDRPHSSIKTTFNHDYPRELVDNINFERGGQILVVTPPPGERRYHVLDWTFGRYPGTPSATSYIRKLFNSFNVETERYVVIEASANTGGVHFLASSRVPVQATDKMTFSVDRRLTNNVPGSGFFRTSFAQVRLFADDGTYYVMDGKQTVGGNVVPAIWKTTEATFTTNAGYIWWEGNASSDDTQWASVNEEIPPVPKDGELQFLLLQSANNPTTSETHFANLNIDYLPAIRGTYQKFRGQQWKVSQEGDYKQVRDENVAVSDSPKRLFKGAMMYNNGTKFVLTGGWYDDSLSPGVVQDELKPYGWFQAQSIWNQYRRVMRLFDGELHGLTENDLPDLIDRFTLADDSPHTRLRYFLCLHFSMSLKTCRWTAYFAEVFKTDMEKVYNDTTEFKYIEQR